MGHRFRLLVAGVALLACGACSVDDIVGNRLTSAAALDAGGNDAGLAGPVDPNCAGTLFCSSFDQGLAGFDTVQSGGTLNIVAQGFDDAAALQPQINEGSGTAYIHTSLNTPGVAELYLRAYLWVANVAVIDDVAIFFLGPAGGFAGINVDLRSEDRWELFLPEHDVSLISDPGTFNRDVWHCVQLHLVVDDSNGEASLVVDGQQVAGQTLLDTYPGEDLDLFTAGIEWSMADQGPIDLLLDDVVLSQSPVECL